MKQIADWLEKLGLGQYAQRFADNDIDFDVLSDLTDQDLEKVGVTSLGHRRKLLRAIANLKGVEQITPAVAVADAPPATPRAGDRPSIPTVRFLRSLVRWNVRPVDARESRDRARRR
jgi:SAM domain (Sterile alpha motif)